jgi:hypothetical protein
MYLIKNNGDLIPFRIKIIGKNCTEIQQLLDNTYNYINYLEKKTYKE